MLAGLAAAVGDPDAGVAAATGLLGRGPGLTPSGDDVLTGFLVGAAAFRCRRTAREAPMYARMAMVSSPGDFC